MNNNLVVLRQVELFYPESPQALFQSVDWRIEAGSFSFLLGPSGAGKSSLLKLMYADLLPTYGNVEVLGYETRHLAHQQRANLRSLIGIVFQDFKLLTHLSIVENVALPLRIQGHDVRRSRAQAREILEWAGVKDFDQSPNTLSGGERQRVAICRAAVTRPKLLLADEPTGNVDDVNAEKLMHLFQELHVSGSTIVMVTHNTHLTQTYPYPIIRLHNHRLYSEPPATSPRSKTMMKTKLTKELSSNPNNRRYPKISL